MKHIPEKLLHIIWKNQLYDSAELHTADGKSLDIIHPGNINPDAGPDFFNARIKINLIDWAGNVEIHVNASDWIKHGHHQDKAYDNVILHVVHYHDCEITDSHNNIIPVFVLPCSFKLLNNYKKLISSEKWVPCEDRILKIDPVHIHHWLSNLLAERLHEKYLRLKGILERTNNDWEQTVFITIASCYGIPINQLPFEILANILNIRHLMRIKDDLFKIEALLFGTAGFLSSNLPSDYYTESLLREYLILKPGMEKEEVPFHLWKFLRLRPGSFPTVRLAMLASLIHKCFPISDAMNRVKSKEDACDLLKVRAGDYWNTHYLPGKISPSRIKYTGRTFLDTLIINAIVPCLFTKGKLLDKKENTDLALDILEEITEEKNEIIQAWKKVGVKAINAFESQALIQLYNKYCSQKRCLDCRIGIRLITLQTDG
ncbi:MAG TPA: DUF2851 family protein [Bacteroidaceae bacterium]|nr:DUF2851 family protein [Bacteroidaceae bacterium]